MRLVQYRDEHGARRVALVEAEGDLLRPVEDVRSTYELANAAMVDGLTLVDAAMSRLAGTPADYAPIVAEGRLLPPLDHPDPAHCLVTGTGLTHLGSADARDAMHVTPEHELTDSMRMFKAGLEGGKPAAGQIGAQPEWFYKGDGSWVVAPEHELAMPGFALDGGEEPEVVALYVIGPHGTPWRLGYALGNEFSDHVLERENYLVLAHSKLRPCSFGPELRTGPLPDAVEGTSRIRRGRETVFEAPLRTGEAHMSHSLANLEHHHFKYARFRRPGDVHVHFLGTATLSFAADVRTQPGDLFEIEAEGFGRPLRNRLAVEPDTAATVRTL